MGRDNLEYITELPIGENVTSLCGHGDFVYAATDKGNIYQISPITCRMKRISMNHTEGMAFIET